MEYLKIEQDFPRLHNSAVTLGKFDGLHRGHRKLVEKITAQKQAGRQAVLVAFTAKNTSLLSQEERLRLLGKLGVDVVLECPLNERIRHMKAERFVQEILAGDLTPPMWQWAKISALATSAGGIPAFSWNLDRNTALK